MSSRPFESIGEKPIRVNTELRTDSSLPSVAQNDRWERIERLAPSVRDGESVGLLEKAALWMASRFDLDASDVLDDMLHFLVERPDLLRADVTDKWLANRCAFFIRSQACAERRKTARTVPLDDADLLPALPAEDDGRVADLLDEFADELRPLVLEIIDCFDEVTHRSSRRANATCLAGRLGWSRDVTRRNLAGLRAQLSCG